MKLADDWKDVLKRAWSVRFMVLAILLSTAEVVLPLLGHAPTLPFAALSLAVTLAALGARIVAQKDLA